MNLLLHRYCAVLTGVLAGDALGAPYETWSAAKIQADFAIRGGLVPFDYDDPWGKDGRFPAGRPTDDSEMTAALARSLIETNAEDEDLYRRFRSCVVDKKSLLCALPAYGFGGTTRRALVAPTYAEAKLLPQTRPPIPTNGAIMRVAPVALRYHGDFKLLVDAARRTSVITHTHPLAIECTIFYTIVLDRLLAGYTFWQAVQTARTAVMPILSEKSLVDYLSSEHLLWDKPDEPDRGHMGGALITLQVALWATVRAKNFREGIELAVGMGGDTDTYGAVAGGLLGAIFGIGEQGIPFEWKRALSKHGYDAMMMSAMELLELRRSEYGK